MPELNPDLEIVELPRLADHVDPLGLLKQLAPFVYPGADKNALTDSWGRPYQYDVTGAKSGGKGPDIWSLGPQSEKDAIIGNWAPKPKK